MPTASPPAPTATTEVVCLTAAQLAERWNVSRAYLYDLLALGLPSIKVGGSDASGPRRPTLGSRAPSALADAGVLRPSAMQPAPPRTPRQPTTDRSTHG